MRISTTSCKNFFVRLDEPLLGSRSENVEKEKKREDNDYHELIVSSSMVVQSVSVY